MQMSTAVARAPAALVSTRHTAAPRAGSVQGGPFGRRPRGPFHELASSLGDAPLSEAPASAPAGGAAAFSSDSSSITCASVLAISGSNWKLYKGRAAVEREFGRLKNEWALLPLRVRGLDRVRLHADLTILA
jgi:hypothetical protein